MRTMKWMRRLTAAVGFTVALAAPTIVTAQVALVAGNWARFEYFDGVGPVAGPGFSFTALTQFRLRVTDVGFSGDAFDIFSGGVRILGTPDVTGGVDTEIFDPETAFVTAGLSSAERLLDAGTYTFMVELRTAGSGFLDGEGFLLVDFVSATPPVEPPVNPPVNPPVDVIPEPAAVFLMATGLLGLAVISRRRAINIMNSAA